LDARRFDALGASALRTIRRPRPATAAGFRLPPADIPDRGRPPIFRVCLEPLRGRPLIFRALDQGRPAMFRTARPGPPADLPAVALPAAAFPVRCSIRPASRST